MPITSLTGTDTFQTWFNKTNTIISTINGITVYSIAGSTGIGVTLSSNIATIRNTGVLSFNGSTGSVGISAGQNVTITQTGNTYTINAPITGNIVTSFNGLTGGVTGIIKINAGSGINVSSGTTPFITNIGVLTVNGLTGGIISVSSFNGLSGAVSGVGSFNGLTGAVSGVGSFNGLTGAVLGVLTINGISGDITNVAKTDISQIFTEIQTFAGGLSGLSASGIINLNDIIVSGKNNNSIFITDKNNTISTLNKSVVIGHDAANLHTNTLGFGTYIGYGAGYKNNFTENIIAIGATACAGVTQLSDSIFIGNNNGTLLDVKQNIVSIGHRLGPAYALNNIGNNCILIGNRHRSEKIGPDNVFIGKDAGLSAANACIGIGTRSLKTSQGSSNIALGHDALVSHISGNSNVVIGAYCMTNSITGSNNIAIGGLDVAGGVVSGDNNIFFGSFSGLGENNNTIVIGALSHTQTTDGTTGSIIIGYNTHFKGLTSVNEIVIGDQTIGSGNNTTTIGNTFTTASKIFGVYTTGQTAGTIASAGTITPVTPISFVSGTTTINTITPPAGIATTGGQITLIPTGAWSTGTTDNIALATTAVINKALIMTYDAQTTKWYPSY